MSEGVVETTEGAPQEGAQQLSAEEQASIERGRSGFSEAPAPAAPERPGNVPEKFWKDGSVDTEALLKSYSELEQRMSAPAAAPIEDKGEVKADGKIAKADDKTPTEEPAANPLASLFETAAADYASSQAFSEETAQKLVEAGIPAEIQQAYLSGLKAESERVLGEIHGYAGGSENYQRMAQWAGSALSEKELEAFNVALESPELRENAILGLYSRFQKARPSEGQQVTTVNGGTSAGDVYASRDELVADQRDPRYSNDPRFRQQVMDKLARSQAAGFRVTPQRMFDAVYTR